MSATSLWAPRLAPPSLDAHPLLLLAAHGTRSTAGLAVTYELAEVVRGLRPELDVAVSFVDVAEPTFADAVAGVVGPLVVVPALLSAGYHVHVDIPRVLRGRSDAVVTPALGPDRMLSEILVLRLGEGRSGAPANSVVLVATGSSDASARADVEAAAADLEKQLQRPVRACFMSGPSADLDAALGPDVDIATYLLAEGAFYDRLRASAAAAGVRTISRPLGVHPRLAELVLRRYDDVAPELARAGAHGVG